MAVLFLYMLYVLTGFVAARAVFTLLMKAFTFNLEEITFVIKNKPSKHSIEFYRGRL